MALHSASLKATGVPGITGALEVLDWNINGVSVEDIDTTHQETSDNGETAAREYEPSVFYDPGTITFNCQWTGGEFPEVGKKSAEGAFVVVLERTGTNIPVIRGTAYLKAVSNLGGALGQKVTADLEFKFSGEILFTLAA